MKKKIFISGINGFLGTRLKEILTDDYELYGIAKRSESMVDGIKVYSSIDLEGITIEPDFLILCHAAVSSGNLNQENEDLFNVNVRLTQKLITRFNNSKIIYISSASIFNTKMGVITEFTISNPVNEYAISKYWAEQLILKSNRAAIVRVSSMFGKNMKESTIIPNYVNQALNKNKIEVWGAGKREQNYVFIDDVCLLIKNAIRKHNVVLNKIILAVHGEEYSNLHLASIIAKQTNAVIEYVNKDHSTSLNYDNAITKNLLNWSPKANFEQEIIKYITWKQRQS
ncbi:MAG: NAD(P)-dependent oxidoreductase [Bacteroidetes bacterium]|nr:NAD(P)-dependent oxidoreductase [Bacteroidota bacterium]